MTTKTSKRKTPAFAAQEAAFKRGIAVATTKFKSESKAFNSKVKQQVKEVCHRLESQVKAFEEKLAEVAEKAYRDGYADAVKEIITMEDARDRALTKADLLFEKEYFEKLQKRAGSTKVSKKKTTAKKATNKKQTGKKTAQVRKKASSKRAKAKTTKRKATSRKKVTTKVAA